MAEETASILDQIIATQRVSHRENFKPKAALERLLELLTERERQILWRRFGLGGEKPETLENIGKSFQVTRERVRQIGRLAVTKLRDNSVAQAIVNPLKQVVVEILEAEGGASTDERLVTMLSEVGDGANANTVRFFIGEMLAEVVTSFGGDDAVYESSWRLRTASIEAMERIINNAHEIITAGGKPISEADLSQQLLAQQLTNMA